MPTVPAPLPRSGRALSPLLPIFLIVAVDILGFTIILPLLPFYSERLGASATTVGALVSVFAICQLVSGPILGQLSDRIGRKPVLLISQLGTLIGFVMFAYADQLWLVFLARAIDGATAGNLTVAQAYISDVTRPEKRAGAFALIGIAFGFGFLVGPGISGYLAHFSYRAPILAAAAMSALSILCTVVLLPRRPQLVHSDVGANVNEFPAGKRLSLLAWGEYARFFREPRLSLLLIQWLLFSFSFSTFVSGFALFCERRYTWDGHPVGVREVGYLFAFSGFLGIIMQGGVVGRAVHWLGERRVVQIGFLCSGIGYAAAGFTHTIPELVVVTAFASVGGAGLRPALTALVSQQAGQREQGILLGLTQSLTSVAQIVAPLLAGLLIHANDRWHDSRYLMLWAFWAGLLGLTALLFQRTTPARVLGAA